MDAWVACFHVDTVLRYSSIVPVFIFYFEDVLGYGESCFVVTVAASKAANVNLMDSVKLMSVVVLFLALW